MGFSLGKIAKSVGGALLGGGNTIGIATGLADSIGSMIGANSANAKAKRQWQRERGWEEEKMRNALQWGKEDALKAGFNPTLLLEGNQAIGSGSPHADTAQTGNFGNFGTNAINSFNTIEQLNQQKQVNETQSFKNFMDGIKAGNEAEAVPTRVKNETRDTLTRIAAQRAEQQRINSEILERTTQSDVNIALKAAQDIENAFNSGDYATALKYINATIDTIKNAGGATASIMQPFIMLKGVRTAKEGLEMMKEFKKSGVFDIMKNYAKSKKK